MEKGTKYLHPKNLLLQQGAEKIASNEYLLNCIDRLKNNPMWKKKMVDGFWNKLTEKDKARLYKEGSLSFTKILGKSITTNPAVLPLSI